MRTRAIAIVLFVPVLAIAVYIAAAQNKSEGLLQPHDRKITTSGASIYKENCASCHGETLKGQPNWQQPGTDGLMPAPPHDDTGHTWHHTDDMLFGITKYGLAEFAGVENYQTAMPIYQEVLSDDEIIAVLSYIKAQWPKHIIARHDEMNAALTKAKP